MNLWQSILRFVRRVFGLKEQLEQYTSEKPDLVEFTIHAPHIHVAVKPASWLFNRKPSLAKPPAGKALSILRFLMPRKAFDRVFAQTFADFRQEFFDDLAEGRHWRARWQHIRFYGTLCITISLWSVTSVGKVAVKLWKTSGG